MAINNLSFFVPGIPRPGGSKRPIGIHGGKMLIIDANPKAKEWKASVALAGRQALFDRPDWELLSCPIGVRFTFCRLRPKNQYGTGRNAKILKPGAPAAPTVVPDVLKLARSTEDALTGIIWRDDACIVHEALIKQYDSVPGVQIDVLWGDRWAFLNDLGTAAPMVFRME